MGIIRTFIALELRNEEVIDKLFEAARTVAKIPGKVRAVERENLHVTIKFLGDIEEGTAQEIARFLHDKITPKIFPNGPETIELMGVGTFGLKIIFANIGVGVELVNNVFREVEDGLANFFNIPRESKPFSSHITLARVKMVPGTSRGKLKSFLSEHENENFGETVVDSVVLKKSQLTPRGPIYSDVEF
jgi:2'-5' RNA ligase